MTSDLSIEQQKAIVLARARKRKAMAMKTEPTKEVPEVSKLKAFGTGLAQGATFNLADEIQSGLQALSPNVTYDEALFQNRDNLDNARNQHGFITGLGEFSGAVASGLGAGTLARVAAPKAAAKLAAIARGAPVRSAVGAGAVSGGVYGLGAGEGGAGERLESAAKGTAMGAVGGGVGYGGARLVGSGINSLTNKTVRSLERKAAEETGQAYKPERALDKVVSRLKKEFPDEQEFQNALNEYINTPGVGLAEVAGDQTKNLAEGAATFKSGAAKSKEYFSARTGGAPDRIRKAFSDNLSPNDDYYGTLDSILSTGKKRAAPKYEKAFSSGAIHDDRIAEFLSQPELKAGLARGMKIQRLEAVAEGKVFDPTDYAITEFNEAGDPIIGKVANMRLLDAGKRGLDAMIKDEMNPITGEMTEMGRALTIFRNSYVDKLKSLNGDYSAALDAGGDYLRASSSLRDGKAFTTMDADQISRKFSKMNEVDKEAFKAGMVRQLRENIDKAGDNHNLYKRTFGNEAIRKKFKAVLSDQEYNVLSKRLRDEERLYNFRDQVQGNSRTALRQNAGAEFDEAALEMVTTAATGGWAAVPLAMAKSGIRKISSGLSDKTAGRVAEILYETNPAKKLALLRQIQNSSGITKSEQRLALQTYYNISDKVSGVRSTAVGGTSGGVLSGGVVEAPRDKDGNLIVVVRPNMRKANDQ